MEIEPDSENHLMDRSFLTANIDDLVAQLTVDEKIKLLAGDGWWHTAPFARLNIPSVKVTDGPSGARGGSAYDMTPAVSFPNATCLAATFDQGLSSQMGTALSKEAKARGATCLLAPTINIQRSPLGGRAFESFSEDPTLSGAIAGAYVKALQDGGVSAAIKHFVCNDHEHNRMGVDCIVGERPLREVYLRPFQIAHKMANPWAYMTGYNKVNGTHASENRWLLEDILRGEWGHTGITMSDWTGTYSIAEAINAGLELEFPGPATWRQPALIKHLVTANKIEEAQIDLLTARILSWVQKLAIRNEDLVYSEQKREYTRWDGQKEDSALVRRIASEGIVLLKNEGILPIRRGKVAVIGPNAKGKVLTGGGSARLNPAWSTNPWQGLSAAKPAEVELEYALGCATAKYASRLDENFINSEGQVGFDAYHYPIDEDGGQASEHVAHDRLTRSELRFNNFTRKGLASDWFTEITATFVAPETGEYDFSATCTGKWRMWVDDELVIDMWAYKKKGSAFYGNGTEEIKARKRVEKGKKHYRFRLLHDTRPPNVKAGTSTLRYDGIRMGCDPAYDLERSIEAAVELSRQVDIALIVCGLTEDWESEGDDRPDMLLPLRTNELIERVSAANPNTVVVLQGGSALAMPWLASVKGVVQTWYGGCEVGTSIADVIYGMVNPSGRLPLTFPAHEGDVSSYLDYKSADGKTYYGQGIWIGYRHFNARQIKPLFPFGHGLSYTTFEYSALQVKSVSALGTAADDWRLTVTAKVHNTGSVAGSHSIHFYLSPPPETALGLKHPKYTLQAWAKVSLQPDEEKAVEVVMDKYAISHWDERRSAWATEPGKWSVSIGYDASRHYGQATFDVGKFFWIGL